jgi:hypothetical protein
MTDKEALRMALEALEWNLPVIEDYGDKEQLNRQHRAITALRTAIKQALAAPVKDNSNYRLDPPGLDLADGTQVSKVWWDGEKLMAKPIPLVEFYQPASECTRSHPHENMDAMCELRTEIARLTNENARLKAQPAPVQEPKMYEDWYDSSSCGHCGMVNGHRPECRHNYKTPAQPAPVQPMAHIVGEIDHTGKVWKPVQPAPVQEPIGYLFQHEETGLTMVVDVQQVEWGFEKNNPRHQKIGPVYTTPPAAQRQWVGLTDEEVYPLANEHLHYQMEGYEVSGIYNLAQAIEAKLKEKNT